MAQEIRDPRVEQALEAAAQQAQAEQMLQAMLQGVMRQPAEMRRYVTCLVDVATDPSGAKILVVATPSGVRIEVPLTPDRTRAILRGLAGQPEPDDEPEPAGVKIEVHRP